MATRFCFVDYDRTMAIVAEREVGGERQLVGVARLVADADRSNAEYAVLVADDWQRLGLGTLLTDYCFEICGSWGIDRVYAETTTDNGAMQSILRRHSFDLAKASNGEMLYQAVLAGRRASVG
jgi:acetyltransferase